jgi:RimJ/RimL family protein N-acetyltransferase
MRNDAEPSRAARDTWAIVGWMELVRTERLVLRRWEEADLAAFFDLYSRDDVMRWLGPQPRRAVATLDQARKGLRGWQAAERELELPLGFWAMVPLVPVASPPVGTIALLPLHEGVEADGQAEGGEPDGQAEASEREGQAEGGGPDGQAEAGESDGLIEMAWHLHPDHQGRGLATEAAAAVLAAAAAAGIEQVLALTDLDNVRSQAVAARLGMRDEGVTDRWFGLTMRQFRGSPGASLRLVRRAAGRVRFRRVCGISRGWAASSGGRHGVLRPGHALVAGDHVGAGGAGLV